MLNNLKISEFVSLIQEYGINPLKDTGTITNITESGGTYTFTVDDLSTIAENDILTINSITGFDFKVLVSSTDTLEFSASKKWVDGEGWVSIGSVSITDIDGTYTKQSPEFYRGTSEILNRLTSMVSINSDKVFPAVIMFDNYFDSFFNYNSDSQYIDVNKKLLFMVADLAPEVNYDDNMTLWEDKWDDLTTVALNFIENLRSFNVNKEVTDERTIYIVGNNKRFSNVVIANIESVEFDAKLTGVLFELEIDIDKAIKLCFNKSY